MNKKHVILTDSLSAMEAIRSSSPRNNRYDLIVAFRNLYTDLIRNNQHSISLCWVPSHVGIQGNEKADKLAKQALVEPDNIEYIGLGTSEYKALITKRVKGIIWQKEWDACKHSKLTKTLIPNVSHGNIPYGTHGILGKLTRLRLNRPFFNRKKEEIQCDSCNEPKTIEHILLTCQKHAAERELIRIQFSNLGQELNIYNILSPYADKELRQHSRVFINSLKEDI